MSAFRTIRERLHRRFPILTQAGAMERHCRFRLSAEEVQVAEAVSLNSQLIESLQGVAHDKEARYAPIIRLRRYFSCSFIAFALAYAGLIASLAFTGGEVTDAQAIALVAILTGLVFAAIVAGAYRRMLHKEAELNCEILSLQVIRAAEHLAVETSHELQRARLFHLVSGLADALWDMRQCSRFRHSRTYRRHRRRLARRASLAVRALAAQAQDLPTGEVTTAIARDMWHTYLKIATGNWRQVGQLQAASQSPRRLGGLLTRDRAVQVIASAIVIVSVAVERLGGNA